MTKIIKAEFQKLRNVRSLHLIYLFPLAITLIALAIFISDFNNKLIPSDANPDFILLNRFYLPFFSFFSPIILTLIYYATLQVEFKNKAWENLRILATSKNKIYVSKMAVGITTTFLYLLASLLFFTAAHFAAQLFYHNALVFNTHELSDALILYAIYFVTYCMLCLVIFNFFLYVDNAILSVGSITFLLLFSAFTLRADWSIYSPLSYPFRVGATYSHPEASKDFLWYSVLLIAVFYLAGLYLFNRLFKART